MNIEFGWLGGGIILFLVVVFLLNAVRIFREYERGVVFTLGRFWQVKGPGLVIIIPIIQQVVRVDLRTVVLEVPTQDVISRDNVSVKVSAVVYLRVIDPQKAIIQVVDYLNATSQLAQTMLRSVLGKHQLDDMLAEREKLNMDIQQALDAQTDSWGIKVANVEIKQVDLTESMIRAIARQAEAERERRAKVIHAEGELQASEKLYQAAKILAQEPQAIQLRYLETLTVIGADKNTTIVFPLPMDLLTPFLERVKQDYGRVECALYCKTRLAYAVHYLLRPFEIFLAPAERTLYGPRENRDAVVQAAPGSDLRNPERWYDSCESIGAFPRLPPPLSAHPYQLLEGAQLVIGLLAVQNRPIGVGDLGDIDVAARIHRDAMRGHDRSNHRCVSSEVSQDLALGRYDRDPRT